MFWVRRSMVRRQRRSRTTRAMTTEEFEDAQSLWKLFYAKRCFQHAENACLFLLNNKVHEDNSIYYPMVAAIYVLYGRPFKKANIVGRLDQGRSVDWNGVLLASADAGGGS
jgi:hypothetical protein